jgi:hypothetical protein
MTLQCKVHEFPNGEEEVTKQKTILTITPITHNNNPSQPRETVNPKNQIPYVAVGMIRITSMERKMTIPQINNIVVQHPSSMLLPRHHGMVIMAVNGQRQRNANILLNQIEWIRKNHHPHQPYVASWQKKWFVQQEHEYHNLEVE